MATPVTDKSVPCAKERRNAAALAAPSSLTKDQLLEQNRRLRDEKVRLERARSRYRDLYDHAPFGYLTLDSLGTILELNLAAISILGTTRDEGPGMQMEQLLHPDDRKILQDHLVRCRKCPVRTTSQFRLRTSGAKPVHIEMVSLPVFREDGGMFLRTAILDVSARQEIDALAKERRARTVLSMKFSALTEMAAGLAHEINNPLTVILCRAIQLKTMAKERRLADLDIGGIADQIEFNSRRITTVVSALQSFSRDGNTDVSEIACLRDIVETTLSVWRERMIQMKIEFKEPVLAPNLKLQCRPKQISQVLWHLVSNAFDAVANQSNPWIEISVAENESEIVISVSDSGRGIALEHLEKLFQPFFTTKPVGKGMGLGLSGSQAIAEQHGGSLELNRRSLFTCFMLRLPRKK